MPDEEARTSRIDIKIGNLSFSAEGDQDWLGEQLTKVLEAAKSAIVQEDRDAAEPLGGARDQRASDPGQRFTTSLSAYIKSKGGESNQVQRFLAASGWLFHRGNKQLNTGMVSKALAEHHQKRLGNPADCLNKNCAKGYCEKQRDHYFITPEGWRALGEVQ